jgi:hypothetical protein
MRSGFAHEVGFSTWGWAATKVLAGLGFKNVFAQPKRFYWKGQTFSTQGLVLHTRSAFAHEVGFAHEVLICTRGRLQQTFWLDWVLKILLCSQNVFTGKARSFAH